MAHPFHKDKMFLIVPVRNAEKDYAPTVARLEADYAVYYPARDTNQDDPTGHQICRANLRAIKDADVVGVIWDGKSQGGLFDLGMAFALNKRVISIELPPQTEGKSFQNMITAWESAQNTKSDCTFDTPL